MKIFIRFMTLMLILFCSFQFTEPTQADEVICSDVEQTQTEQGIYSDVPTIGIPAPDLTNSTFRNRLRAAAGFSDYVYSIMSNGTSISYDSQTKAMSTASKVGSEYLNLEVWDGYKWVTAASKSSYSYNTSSHYATATSTGISGKYYRLNTIHLAVIGGTTYRVVITTSYIQIR